ncbi:MAG: Sulfite exporter TauE/SafE [Verrucomicrobia bacterium ADurb.Bin118]|nr:MAG: Sulfite exporter TauE/SafE [Verrucomicrobia bacterium ADurb.Bin118]
MQYLMAALIGLGSGVASGLFGVGGGIIMVPAMVLLLKLDMKVAVATSLVVIIPTSCAGSLLNHAFGRIDWGTVFALAPLAIGGGFLGTWLKEQIPSGDLRRVFGGFIVVIGLRLLFFK